MLSEIRFIAPVSPVQITRLVFVYSLVVIRILYHDQPTQVRRGLSIKLRVIVRAFGNGGVLFASRGYRAVRPIYFVGRFIQVYTNSYSVFKLAFLDGVSFTDKAVAHHRRERNLAVKTADKIDLDNLLLVVVCSQIRQISVKQSA